MMPSDDAWRENLTRTLSRITVGSGAILAGHLCIGALFLTISVAGPDSDSAITGLPMAVGAFSSALLASGLAGQAVVRKAWLRKGALSPANPQRAAIRIRPLTFFGAAGLAITVISGLLAARMAGEPPMGAMGWAGTGCVLHLQTWVMIWSATRMITKAREEAIPLTGE